ncbi:AraC family transcriptional regulator [Ferrimonas futtsuensis]|uniref:AraC family transcriptional regulator n=1 Tax=Ferrimonas futtsuensis TaxID=364764 RepID=UPI0003F7F8C3|nr:AraC family transcriptional regulator [Ferrimonas futtsuensis]
MTQGFRIRVSALVGIDRLIEAMGGNAEQQLALARLTPAQLHSEQTMDIEQLARLLECCASDLCCPEFGLKLGALQDLTMLGELGMVLRRCDTPEQALKAVRSLMAFHNQSEYWDHRLQGQLLAIQRFDNFHGETDSRHYKELAISACFRLCRDLIGPDFRAARVDFAHAPLSSRHCYRDHFGCEVMFNQPQDTLWIPGAFLRRQLHPSQPEDSQRLSRQISERLKVSGQGRVAQVSGLIQQTLGSGQANIDHIARLLGLNRRTLQRQLKTEGVEFRALLSELRMQSACWHLRFSNMEVTLLAEILGYHDLSAFSRAFKRRMGVSPHLWRSAHREGLTRLTRGTSQS